MKVMKWSAIAFAVTAATSQLASAAAFVSDQAEAKGFVEDSTLNLLLRNYYYNKATPNGGGSNHPRDWTQSVQGVFSSGFTQGTVGFGVDAFAYGVVKLDGSNSHSGTGNLPVDSDGDVPNSFGKAGVDAKIRFSKTQLTIGDMQPSTSPVFAVGGSKQLPQTATGIQIQSSELKGLDLEGGHFTSSTSQTSTNRDGELGAAYAGVTANSIDYAGGRYAVTDALTLGVYGSKLEDVWNQYYANVNYVLALPSDQSVAFDFNYYKTTDTGHAKAGDIDNNTFSLAAAYTFLTAHTVTLGFQKVNGGTPFDYIGVGGNKDGSGFGYGDSIFLANSVQWSDFNGPGERSWKAQYNLDMATFGVPGLSFMTRYVKGDDIHAASASSIYSGFDSGQSHHEADLEAKYVVQTGPVKNMSFRMRQAWHRSSGGQIDGDTDEFRIIVDYPISIL
jgi:imipenem/basic amino acid-specific outer membrane pore